MLLVVELAANIYFPFFVGAWINCYILGYVIGHVTTKLKPNGNVFKKILLCVVGNGLVLNGIQITIDYLLPINVDGIFKIIYVLFIKNYAHVFLGISLFIIGYLLLKDKIKNKILKCFLDKTDKYSYAIYLTHHIYILGPVSLLSDFSGEEVLWIIFLIIISSIILDKLTRIIIKILKPIIYISDFRY